jgi:hypothetical protein
MNTTPPALPASLTETLAECDLTIAEWDAMSDEERQEQGLTVAEHADAYADCSAEDMAALEEWLRNPPAIIRQMLAEAG